MSMYYVSGLSTVINLQFDCDKAGRQQTQVALFFGFSKITTSFPLVVKTGLKNSKENLSTY